MIKEKQQNLFTENELDDIFSMPIKESKKVIDTKLDKPNQPRSRAYSQSTVRKTNAIYRRAFSETQLLDLFIEIKSDYIYNFITGGDIDALSYVKLILRNQNIDYMFFSTWCMANEDIYQIKDWLESGRIKKIDAYVGEIFPGTYRFQYAMLKPIIEKYGGRVAVFRNHSKIFAGYGNKFYFGVQTSANINMNPRTENACIQTNKKIFDFYFDYFNGIVSFEK